LGIIFKEMTALHFDKLSAGCSEASPRQPFDSPSTGSGATQGAPFDRFRGHSGYGEGIILFFMTICLQIKYGSGIEVGSALTFNQLVEYNLYCIKY